MRPRAGCVFGYRRAVDSEERTLYDGGSAPTLEPTASDEARPTPLRVGRFYIFRPIAEGGMGQVLLAYDDTLNRKLAIKLWRPQASRGDDLRGRMLREAQALARLSHPNVVQVYEVGDHRDLLYLAMEYVEGRTLREWARQDRPELPQILERYLQAGEGLAAAHRAGVLHRDFKPDNAIVGDDGRVRVLDFGLARADSNTAEPTGPRPTVDAVFTAQDGLDNPITRAGSVLGTPAYMPPEQLAGHDTDARSDLYSFCVALWEALHGLRPFAGKTVSELAVAIQAQRPRESKRPVPGWLRAALLRGLAPGPDARWPSMDALLRTLSAGARRRRRRIIAAAGVGLLAVLAVGVGVFMAARAREVASCEARGAAIDEVWSPDARATVRSALLASGQGFAAHTADRVDTLLDEYVSTWSKGQVDTCRRAQVEHSWEPALAERADACLDDRRLELAGLVGVLREADGAATRRAIEAATALPPIDLCLDQGALERRPQLPREPEARAEAVAIRSELARVRSLESTGRFTDSLPLAEALITRADALAWPPLRAEARLLAAGAAAYLGDRDTARTEARLEDALFLALDAGHDALATQTALELIDFTGLMLLRPRDGERWARLARSLLPRLGAEAPPLAADLECLAGELDKIQSRFDLAGAAFERCHAARIAAYGQGHPSVARALGNLASLASLRNQQSEARDLLRRALAILEPAYGPDHPTIARYLGDLGEALVRTGDTAAAQPVLERALAIDTQVFGPDHERVGSDHYALGELFLAAGKPADAKQHLRRALALFEGVPSMGRPMQIAVLGHLSSVHRELGELDDALTTTRQALALYEAALGPGHASLIPVIVELAEIQVARRATDEARRAIARADDLLKDSSNPSLAPTLTTLAELKRQLGDPAAAERDLARARALSEAPGDPAPARTH